MRIGTPVKFIDMQKGDFITVLGLVTEVYTKTWFMVTWFDGKKSEVDTHYSYWDTLEVLEV